MTGDTLPMEPASPPDTVFAEVVFPIPIDRAYTYAVPLKLHDRARPGMRAVAPLRNRTLTGYIVAVSDTTDVPEVRPLHDLPDDEPVFRPELLDLCRWLADYYCCSWGEALQSAVPAGIQLQSRKQYRLVHEQIGSGRFTDRQQAVIAALYKAGKALTPGQLARATGYSGLTSTFQSLVKRGMLIEEIMQPKSTVSVRTETVVVLEEDTIPDPEGLVELQRRAPRQAAVYLDLLYGEPERLVPTLYEKHQVNASILRALADKKLVRLEKREYYRIPELDRDDASTLKHALNAEQQAAYATIVEAMEAEQFHTFLLEGITGSGKTEVYLQAIERALELGRDAIILVPEISLTPQTVGRFKARFDAQIAVLHSGLGSGERYDEWRRAQRGEVRIVVGARSAIFAPLPNVGIIIVDEEHDSSYKQGETPRYHARDVAIMRARMNNAVCVVGSATPSIESAHNATKGKSTRLALTRRATNASLPSVELIDMRTEAREVAGVVLLSRVLEKAIAHCVAAGDQVLLLLNRRGFAPFVLCPMCGWVAYCADCQVTMTYHAKGHFLACHYCNASRTVPEVCDECQFQPLLYLGTGTQRIEEVLQRTFPHSRIERMDADTTSGKGGHAKILGRLANREIDILIGTQMIAKGHDYPAVTLVGVINADTGLALPDFRAAEGVFQLLTQVAGRAGRGERPGKVMIQTYRPHHFAIQAAAAHDYAGFFEREIKDREAAGYPPFRRMANLAIESEDALEAERAAAVVSRIVRDQRDALGFTGLEVLGPAPATVSRVKKKYRWNIGLLSRSTKRLNVLVRAVMKAYAQAGAPPDVQLKVDLDPYGVY